MKIKLKKTLYLFLSVLCIVSVATGCDKKKDESKDNEDGNFILCYGDNSVTKGETYIYINTVKERYEIQYGADVWSTSIPEGDGVSIVDLTKEEVINDIVKVKTLVLHADDYGIKLTDEEKAELDKKADDFYNGLTDEDIEKMELSKELIYSVYEECEIANKVRQELINNDPIEISDEESRMTRFYDMFFCCYEKNANGAIINMSEESKKRQYENALQACSTLSTSDINIYKGAENIDNLSKYYKLEDAGEKVMSPEEIKNVYGEDVYNVLYGMSNGEYSSVIETEYGYHVFFMMELTDQQATASRKQKMLEEAIDAKIDEKLQNWIKETDKDFKYPDSVNMELYDTIKIN